MEIARYIDGAWIEATPPEGDLKQKAKLSHHKLKILRNRLIRAKRPLVGSSEYCMAFAECVYDKYLLNANKRPRGRVTKQFADFFAKRVGQIFTAVTGRPATIQNSRHGDNTGPFGELLKELQIDISLLAKCLDTNRSRLSGNLARLARQGRKNTKIAPRQKK